MIATMFFSCFEFETWDKKVVTLSARNYPFLVSKQKKIIFLSVYFFYLNKQLHRIILLSFEWIMRFC